jgi:catechol 2,3-dioxygenase-like lactoylglutathione lyase family enzyme
VAGFQEIAETAAMNLNQITLPALDMAASSAFYRRLGFKPIVAAPHYARFQSPQGDATLSIEFVSALAGKPPTVIYLESDQLDDLVAELKTAGLVFDQDPRDEPWLWREARLSDPAGNVICLYFAGQNRLDPPWRVRE